MSDNASSSNGHALRERFVTEIQIDSDIPLPSGVARGNTAALRKMEVGQSFVYVPRHKDISSASQRNSVYNLTAKIDGKKFVCRIVEEDGKNVVRVWRIA